eukprot:3932185-Rhodomonas_salina.1
MLIDAPGSALERRKRLQGLKTDVAKRLRDVRKRNMAGARPTQDETKPEHCKHVAPAKMGGRDTAIRVTNCHPTRTTEVQASLVLTLPLLHRHSHALERPNITTVAGGLVIRTQLRDCRQRPDEILEKGPVRSGRLRRGSRQILQPPSPGARVPLPEKRTRGNLIECLVRKDLLTQARAMADTSSLRAVRKTNSNVHSLQLRKIGRKINLCAGLGENTLGGSRSGNPSPGHPGTGPPLRRRRETRRGRGCWPTGIARRPAHRRLDNLER